MYSQKKYQYDLDALSHRDRGVFQTIYDYMDLDNEDMSTLSGNMLIILGSGDQSIREELYELYRRIKEKQWEDDDRAFKKNVFMIIEALAEDV